MAQHSNEAVARRPPHNWGLLLFLVLSVEFWIIVATEVAENL
jgi:hypothetical protein